MIARSSTMPAICMGPIRFALQLAKYGLWPSGLKFATTTALFSSGPPDTQSQRKFHFSTPGFGFSRGSYEWATLTGSALRIPTYPTQGVSPIASAPAAYPPTCY